MFKTLSSLLALAVTLALNSTVVEAKQITVSEVKQLQQDISGGSFTALAEWNALSYYLQGVVEGIIAHNKAFAETDTSKLFCPPKKKGYSLEDILKLLNDADRSHAKKPAAEFLFNEFAKLHPC